MEQKRNCDIDLRLDDVMPLLSPGLRRKLAHSVDLVRKAERLALAYDPENGFYNTFSGGKDSQALYHVVKLSGVRARTHMSLTSVDPPEVLRFVRRHYPDVELIAPKRSIFRSAVERKLLPTMRVRWCCEEYKEHTGQGRVTLIGIRHAESARRARRNEVEISSRKFSGTLEGLEEWREERDRKLLEPRRGRKPKAAHVSIVNAKGERTLGCIGGRETLLVSPIIDWTEDDVWAFLRAVGAAHCELYDQGFTRIGCIGCPMSSPAQKLRENKRWPHVRRNWIQAIKAIRGGGGLCKIQPIPTGGASPRSLTDTTGGTCRRADFRPAHPRAAARMSLRTKSRRTSTTGGFRAWATSGGTPESSRSCTSTSGTMPPTGNSTAVLTQLKQQTQ